MRHHLFALSMLLVVIYGCSGTGADSSSAPPPTPDPNLTVPVRIAFANVVQHGFNQPFTLTGTQDESTPTFPAPRIDLTGNGQFILEPAIPTTLCGSPASRSNQTVTGTITANGVPAPFSSLGVLFYRSDNTTLATDSPKAFFMFAPVAYPDTVKAGDTGPTAEGTEFIRDCTGKPSPSKITGSYVVTADSVNSLIVTFFTLEKTPSGDETKTTTAYRITPTGAITLVSVVTTDKFIGSGFRTLTFTF